MTLFVLTFNASATEVAKAQKADCEVAVQAAITRGRARDAKAGKETVSKAKEEEIAKKMREYCLCVKYSHCPK